MKKLLILALSVLMLTCLFGVSATAYAESATQNEQSTEQTEQTEQTETTDSEEKSELDKLKEKIAELTAKLNEKTGGASDYFTTTILPLLISLGGGLITGLGVLVPFIKKNSKYKALLVAYNKVTEELDNKIESIQTILSSTDVTKIKQAMSDLCGEELTKVVEKLKIDSAEMAELKLSIKTVMAKLDSLIAGAMNAWAKSSDAVSKLTENPSETVLKDLMTAKDKLIAYIRTIKGEEADEIINQITA